MHYNFETILKISRALQNGIDPVTGQKFSEDTVLNSPAIKKYCQDVEEVVRNYQEMVKKTTAKPKKPFSIKEDRLREFQYSEVPISLSKICFQINTLRDDGTKPIRASDMARRLCEEGYLSEITEDGHRVPTEEGTRIGISCEERELKDGKRIVVNIYDVRAQKMVIEALN